MKWRAYKSLRGCLAVATSLLLCGCGPSIHDMVARGRLDKVEAILQENPSLVHERDRKLKTPLHKAVTYKQMEAMELLLAHGADINIADISGMTPLHVAAMLGRSEEAERLLARGADPTRRDHFGDAPLHTAAIFGHGHIIGLLVKAGITPDLPNGDGETAHTLALRYRQERVARYIEHLRKQT